LILISGISPCILFSIPHTIKKKYYTGNTQGKWGALKACKRGKKLFILIAIIFSKLAKFWINSSFPFRFSLSFTLKVVSGEKCRKMVAFDFVLSECLAVIKRTFGTYTWVLNWLHANSCLWKFFCHLLGYILNLESEVGYKINFEILSEVTLLLEIKYAIFNRVS